MFGEEALRLEQHSAVFAEKILVRVTVDDMRLELGRVRRLKATTVLGAAKRIDESMLEQGVRFDLLKIARREDAL